MKHVSIRDLQLNFAKYRKEFPLLITRYKKPIAMVIDVESELYKRFVYERKTTSVVNGSNNS